MWLIHNTKREGLDRLYVAITLLKKWCDFYIKTETASHIKQVVNR